MSTSRISDLGLRIVFAAMVAAGLVHVGSSPATAQVSDWSDTTGDLWQLDDWDGDGTVDIDYEWRLLPSP